MKPVTIYTGLACPFCTRAKALLRQKGIAFVEHDVTLDSRRRAEMLARSNGRTTVPQIFIGDLHVGGCDDLAALERAGRLDALLR